MNAGAQVLWLQDKPKSSPLQHCDNWHEYVCAGVVCCVWFSLDVGLCIMTKPLHLGPSVQR